MKFHLSRQALYILLLSAILLVMVLIFSFGFLIPEGKEYRTLRIEKKKSEAVLSRFRMWHDETLEKLKGLQSDHKHVITAFDTRFDPQRFVKLNSVHFESLQLSEVARASSDAPYTLYEVNATSRIDSPQNFYAFLDAVNKSDWIIAVNFPIHFVRERDMIRSTFTMKVHSLVQE